MRCNTTRYRIELATGSLGGVLFITTLIVPEWIEVLFGWAPDQGSGALELVIALGLLTVALLSFVLARFEWRRSMKPTSEG